MKRVICILLMLILTFFLFSQDVIPPPPDMVLDILEDLKDFFPRHEGSKAEKQVITYIENKMTDLNLSYTKTDFNTSDSFHSFSESIQVTLQGKEKDTIIFLIPLNHPLNADKETAGLINIALGLTLINHYFYKKPPITLQFLFLGAEYGEGPFYPLGSTLYLEDFFPDYPVMLFYFSFKNIPKRIVVGGAGQGRITPYWFTIRCSEALREAGVPFLLSGNKNQIFRLGLAQGKTPIEPFLQAKYPSITLSGASPRFTVLEKKDWIFSFCSFIDILIQKSKEGIPEYWDQHYLFFQVYNFYLIIKENLLLVIFIIIFGLAIIYTLLYHNQIKSNINLLFKYFWVIPLIFLTTFILLLLSTLAIQGILQFRKDFAFWEAYPFLFLILKISLSVLLFIICLKLLRFIPIPMSRNFYSTLSIFLLLIDIIFITLINISFVYYYVWAFIFVFLAFLFKNKIIRLLLILPSPYWIVKLILDFFIFIPEPVFCHTVLFSLLKGNIVISLLILPFICIFVNIFLFFFPARHKHSRVQYNVTGLFFLFLNLILLLCTFFVPHFSVNRPQKVTARNIIDLENLTHYIEINSSSPLGELSIRDENTIFNFNTGSRTYIIPRKHIPDLLTIETTHTPFLNRNNVIINIQSTGTPYKVYFEVHSDREFTLYDSNFPFKKKENGEGYEIQIGAYPPSLLEIQLTLTQNLDYIFTLHIDYINIPFQFTVFGENKDIKTFLTLKDKITLF